MTLEKFIKLRDIKIRDNEHLKVIKCFFPYLRSVSRDERLLPSLLENILVSIYRMLQLKPPVLMV